MNPPSERLNKVLAQLGIGSRRNVDNLIAERRVKVNGNIATLGQRVGPTDELTLDDKIIAQRPVEKVILAFHKPRGVTTTKKDPFAKVTVMHYLPKEFQHLNPVGRLDRASRGLLLLTNDGDMAYQLEHPKFEHDKEYEVEAKPYKPKSPAEYKRDIDRLAHEIIDPALQTNPVLVKSSHFNEQKQLAKLTLVLQEGKKRQIRRLLEALGYEVTDLFRTRVNTVSLANLKEGEYRIIRPDEIKL